MSETHELLKRVWHRELSADEAYDEITDKYDKAADKVMELQLTQSHLRLLAEAVLKAHLIEEWDTIEDRIVERPCQCHVCKVAREVMDGLV